MNERDDSLESNADSFNFIAFGGIPVGLGLSIAHLVSAQTYAVAQFPLINLGYPGNEPVFLDLEYPIAFPELKPLIEPKEYREPFRLKNRIRKAQQRLPKIVPPVIRRWKRFQ